MLTIDNYGSACDYGTLGMDKVKGKIVYCLGSSGQDYTIKLLGGVGTIFALDEPTDTAFTSLLPATNVLPKEGVNIDRYINSTRYFILPTPKFVNCQSLNVIVLIRCHMICVYRNPQAIIYKTKTVNTTAPFLASFSSRGPQYINLNILKPDIAAPGLDILAAYSQLASITGFKEDNRIAPFNIISGTSMACPHAAGAAAYVKSFHPSWSPAAIKSALMTTGKHSLTPD